MKKNRPLLLVEDDEIDVMTTKRAFKDIKFTNQLIVTNNGEEALDYLNNSENEKPSLILLDINMPRMNGLELLQVLKKDDNLKLIPVIVLTTSQAEADKIAGYDHGIAGYMLKPLEYMDFVEVIKTIDQYWSLSEIPEII